MRRAFTLVELAIVLVIIGLLVTGILAGQELIEQSRIRAQIRQLAEFDTAKSVFQAKYNSLPGDRNRTYGIFSNQCMTFTPDTLMDGRISSSNNIANIPIIHVYCEPWYFFIDLAQAALIKGKYYQSIPSTSWVIGENYPKAEISFGGITAGSNSDGFIYYYLGISDNNTSNTTSLSVLSTKGIMTPAQANSLDEKLDDGNPSTGGIRAVRNSFVTDTTLNDCLGATTSFYNLSSTDTKCRLIIRSK